MTQHLRKFFQLTSIVALSASVLTPVAWAQEAPDAASLFGEVIDVRVVNLEAVVTQNGERVSGLTPEDFVLTVDGQEVPIEYFTEVLGGTAVATGDEMSNATIPALQPGQPVSTSFLVFIDNYFTLGARRNRVLSRLIDQLPMLDPEDRMAIVAFDGRRLAMLSSWSQSRPDLERVLKEALETPAQGAHTFAQRKLHGADGGQALAELGLESEPNLLGGGAADASSEGNKVTGPMPTMADEQTVGVVQRQVERVVAAATSSLRGFANPPGRKVLLMLSGGWPYSPADTLFDDREPSIYSTHFSYGDNLYGPLIETANRLSYTIYPISAPFDPEGSSNLDASLRFIARDTGGRALFRKETLNAFTEVVADTRSYYWLGFTPEWKGDDESHRVDVRPRDPKLKVRSRQSFADFSRQQEVTMMVESTLLLGDAPDAMATMPAEVGELTKAGRGKVDVLIRVLVPMKALTFLPHAEGYVAQAELRFAIQDSSGTTKNSPVVPMTITLDRPPEAGEMRRWETNLTLRKEHHDLVVSIYDNASGSILTSKLEVDPN